MLKGVIKTIKNKTKEQYLGATLLGNLLAGTEIVRTGSGDKKGKGIVRAGYGKEWDI